MEVGESPVSAPVGVRVSGDCWSSRRGSGSTGPVGSSKGGGWGAGTPGILGPSSSVALAIMPSAACLTAFAGLLGSMPRSFVGVRPAWVTPEAVAHTSALPAGCGPNATGPCGERRDMTKSVERPGSARWVPARPTLQDLRSAVQECRGCELYADATQGVMGSGPDRAALMVVGEQPGDKEDQEGEPFVGPAGRLLDRALADAGLDPAAVYRTNVVKHFRFSGTRGKQRIHKSPSRVHVAACGPWLLAELALVRPSGVLLLGGTAGKALYGPSFRVGEVRGQLRDWPEDFHGTDGMDG